MPNFSKLEQIASVFELDVVELLSFGEKNVICLIGDNSVNISQMIGSSKELIFEMQKLQLGLEHKEAMLAQKDKEIQRLEELIALMKTQLP